MAPRSLRSARGQLVSKALSASNAPNAAPEIHRSTPVSSRSGMRVKRARFSSVEKCDDFGRQTTTLGCIKKDLISFVIVNGCPRSGGRRFTPTAVSGEICGDARLA
jgi:hypothetical protein